MNITGSVFIDDDEIVSVDEGGAKRWPVAIYGREAALYLTLDQANKILFELSAVLQGIEHDRV